MWRQRLSPDLRGPLSESLQKSNRETICFYNGTKLSMLVKNLWTLPLMLYRCTVTQPVGGPCSTCRRSQSCPQSVHYSHGPTHDPPRQPFVRSHSHSHETLTHSSLSLTILSLLYKWICTLPLDLYTLEHAHALLRSVHIGLCVAFMCA